ncbi:hypothetical protein [Microbacterium oleivorans]|uniref:hypothetical protein n=1 Tax=Microbacterium oleivorans TaxID=273677 RepID=UPI00097682A8|nr:hypothetical protein [Microbacterium oleivorans]
MTADTVPAVRPTARRRGLSRGTVMVVGAVLVPLALTVIFNSWGPLTDESAVQMAFARVAGLTIAILSSVTIVVMTVRRRSQWPAVAGALLVASLVVAWSTMELQSTADDLLNRLELVESVPSPGR